MNDDWRLRIDLHENGPSPTGWASSSAVEGSSSTTSERSFHDRVVVSVDGAEVFCYTGTTASGRARRGAGPPPGRAARLGRGDRAEPLKPPICGAVGAPPRWATPRPPRHREYEREGRVARERRESAERGYPEFLQVRVQCAHRAPQAPRAVGQARPAQDISQPASLELFADRGPPTRTARRRSRSAYAPKPRQEHR